MKTLSTPELENYLKNVRNLESSCYKQEQYIQHLKTKLNEVRNPNLHALNKLYAYEMNSADFIPLSMAYGYFGAIGGAILGFISWLGSGFHGFFKHILGGGVIGIILGALLGFVIHAAKKSDSDSQIDAKNREIQSDNAIRQAKNNQILEECRKQEPLLVAELTSARKIYAETQSALEKYYSQDVIYQKYRGLVPITMFCEYFESGRCSVLTGHEGAYNIYENEVRGNLILVKLNDIISRLDRIEGNQYMLSHLISDCQQEVQRMSHIADAQVSHLRRIEENSAISAYYNQISAENTECIKWLTFLSSSN